MKTKLIVVLGPTAVGKTALGIKLAQQFHGEIISGDSQQVYQKLDIGTAKATAAEQAAVPHHLIDAFRSTLEEAKHADLIIHVVDCSNPEHETQMQVVYQTLKELGVEGKPIFTLMNKQDLLSEEEKNLFERDMQADRTIEISVKDGTGLDELREVLLSFLRNRKKYVERLYGYDEMGKIQLLRKYGQIVTEEYRDDGVAVTGYVPNEYYNQIQ